MLDDNNNYSKQNVKHASIIKSIKILSLTETPMLIWGLCLNELNLEGDFETPI